MNTVLKQGDLVKYHIEKTELTDLGFKLGQFYEVVKGLDTDSLDLRVPFNVNIDLIGLYNSKQGFSDYADHFTKHVCPVILTKGNGELWPNESEGVSAMAGDDYESK